jgi:hypothetical protein
MPLASAVTADLQSRVNRRFGTRLAVAAQLVPAAPPQPFETRIPAGRLTEIFGLRSSGKTSIAFAALARCTQAGALGAYVDCGQSFFAPAAAGAGVETRRLIVVRPQDAAAARRAVDALVRGSACEVVVFDCSDSPHALQTHHCARLVAQAEKTGTALVVISSGNVQAIAAFASLRLRACGLTPLWQEGSDGGARLLGCIATVEVAKARMAVSHHSAQFKILLPDIAGTWPAEALA